MGKRRRWAIFTSTSAAIGASPPSQPPPPPVQLSEKAPTVPQLEGAQAITQSNAELQPSPLHAVAQPAAEVPPPPTKKQRWGFLKAQPAPANNSATPVASINQRHMDCTNNLQIHNIPQQTALAQNGSPKLLSPPAGNTATTQQASHRNLYSRCAQNYDAPPLIIHVPAKAPTFNSMDGALKALQRKKRLEAWREKMKQQDANDHNVDSDLQEVRGAEEKSRVEDARAQSFALGNEMFKRRTALISTADKDSMRQTQPSQPQYDRRSEDVTKNGRGKSTNAQSSSQNISKYCEFTKNDMPSTLKRSSDEKQLSRTTTDWEQDDEASCRLQQMPATKLEEQPRKIRHRLFQNRLSMQKASAAQASEENKSKTPVSVSQYLGESNESIVTAAVKATRQQRKASMSNRSKKTQAPIRLQGSLWDYDFNPSDSSDDDDDFHNVLRMDVDIVGDKGNKILSKTLPLKSQIDSTSLIETAALHSKVHDVEDQIQKADALIQSMAPSYLLCQAKCWADVATLQNPNGQGSQHLIAAPPSNKFYASSNSASEFLSLFKSIALKSFNKSPHSNQIANNGVMSLLSIIKESRNNPQKSNPYRLMKRVWELIQTITTRLDDAERETARKTLMKRFDTFLPHGYSLTSKNYCWGNNARGSQMVDSATESCARTHLVFNYDDSK